MDFSTTFFELTGHKPFRWQRRLYEEMLKGWLRPALDLPTGIGKTSILAIWLLARANNPKLPCRLVYVVDRRTVVDQATEEAVKLRSALDRDTLAPLRRDLCLQGKRLPISTLRGQFLDNREWLSDPATTAIIIGTIDMIGSRLLFEGYGVSRGMRPFHAGLLGADSLLVLDEAHLSPPFEALIGAIQDDASLHPSMPEYRDTIPAFKTMSLSATGSNDGRGPFTLKREDLLDQRIAERIQAPKQLAIHEITVERKLRDELVEQAWRHSGAHNRVLVYCDSRKTAQDVEKELSKRAKAEKTPITSNLMVGARRVHERERLSDWLEENGFMSGGPERTGMPAFLIATSAGEVGVDLDADHLVCDLVAYERMVQRFGRVNRLGKKQSSIVVIAQLPKLPKKTKPQAPDGSPPIPPIKPVNPGRKAGSSEKDEFKQANANYKKADKAFKKESKAWKKILDDYEENRIKAQQDWQEYDTFHLRLNLLRQLGDDASPGAILDLKKRSASDPKLAGQIHRATTIAPLRPTLNRALVDAWSMTSLKQHAGRPEVAPWLRGWTDDKPLAMIAWRQFLPWRNGDQTPDSTDVSGFFEAAPIHVTETLETYASEIATLVIKRAQAIMSPRKPRKSIGTEVGEQIPAETPGILVLNQAGEFQQARTLGDLVGLGDKRSKSSRDEFMRSLAGKQIIANRLLAGLGNAGLLDVGTTDPPDTLDHGWSEIDIEAIGYRIHSAEQPEGEDWRSIYRFPLTETDEDQTDTAILVAALRRPNAPIIGDPAIARSEQSLAEHHRWAGHAVAQIADGLRLSPQYKQMLVTAILMHDAGKARERWQNAMNADRTGRPFAKTKGGGNLRLLDGYRHEFGSLGDAEQDAAIQALPEAIKDLALHLIASHHGHARPVIPAIDPAVPPSKLGKRARDTALRYARLQQRWGPWGLAWWEAVFRSADRRASAWLSEGAEGPQ